MECAGHIVGGSDKVCVISAGDRVHARVCCLDGLQCAISHQGEKSTAERVTLLDTTSRYDVDGAGWVVSEHARGACGGRCLGRGPPPAAGGRCGLQPMHGLPPVRLTLSTN